MLSLSSRSYLPRMAPGATRRSSTAKRCETEKETKRAWRFKVDRLRLAEDVVAEEALDYPEFDFPN